jgi:two-component system nitrate/nitrite sensor histidine kinase NarX
MNHMSEQVEQQVQARTADLQALNAQLQREIAQRERIECELQAHIAFESIIIAISTDFINVPTDQIDDGIQRALQTVSTFAGVDRSYIFLFSDDATTMSNVYEWCAPGIESAMSHMQQVPVNDFSWSNRQLLRRDILYIPRVADLPPEAAAERAEFERQSIQSLIAVPMPTDERVIGFLGFDSVCSEMCWTDESITLLKIVGQILVNALKRKYAEEQLRQSQQQLEQHVSERTRQISTLLEVQRVLSSRLDPEAVMQMIAEEARQLIGVSFGALFVREDETLRVAALAGTYSSDMMVGYSMPLRESATGLALLSREVVRTSSLDDPRIYHRAMKAACIQSMVGIPLLSGETPIGVISVGDQQPGAFDEADEHMLAMLAPGAVIALENARLYAQAQQAAALEERQRLARDLHDAVTQTLFSASMIADVLPRLWERKPEEGQRRLEELRQLTRGALAEMRTLLLELRPDALNNANLGDVLCQLGEATTGRARLPVTVTVNGEEHLPQEVRVTFYRVAQEAIQNVIKHASAQQIELSLHLEPGRATLRIRDDGRGFDVSCVDGEHFGLRIMGERAEAVGAVLRVESKPGCGTPERGTTVTITWNETGEETL